MTLSQLQLNERFARWEQEHPKKVALVWIVTFVVTFLATSGLHAVIRVPLASAAWFAATFVVLLFWTGDLLRSD